MFDELINNIDMKFDADRLSGDINNTNMEFNMGRFNNAKKIKDEKAKICKSNLF